MGENLKPDHMIRQLERLTRALVDSPFFRELDEVAAGRTAKKVLALAVALADLADTLDPIGQPSGRIQLFAPATIGRLIGQEIQIVKRKPLDGVGKFYGSGVYALYYKGDFPAYAAITGTDCPIYVGVAHPRDRNAVTAREQGMSISERLRKHRENILAANGNLRIEDFEYRYLATESGWQGTAEDFLIWLYRPVWNKEMKVCSGFGKHGDRARTELSSWDVLHGGRTWTRGQVSRRGITPERVSEAIVAHFRSLLSMDNQFWSARFTRDWVRRNAAQV